MTDRAQAYKTPFQRHLSFFDRNNDGVIHFGESLRGNLAIGLDLPVALAMALGYHVVYGNTRPFFFGPFNPINISRVSVERNMLGRVNLGDAPLNGFDRKSLLAASGATSAMDRVHVIGLWAFAANRNGLLTPRDIERYQDGLMLYDLAARRERSRQDVLPLHRGGPISVAGHSWFVGQLFGVTVYKSNDLVSKK